MKKVIQLALAVTASAMIAGVAWADCNDASTDDPINDTLVEQLRQQAETAEMRANSASNPNERTRWEMVAENLRNQAENAEKNHERIANAARRICNIVTEPAHADSSDSSDSPNGVR